MEGEIHMPFVALSMPAIWFIAMVVFLVIEGIVPGLVSIWFAFGALAALISAALNAPLWLQLVWFGIVSVAALWLTRPLVKKYVNNRTQPTNLDSVIGRDCVVKETVDNLNGTGAVWVDGKMWTARSEDAEKVIPEGKTAVALRIEGVKLIVKEK